MRSRYYAICAAGAIVFYVAAILMGWNSISWPVMAVAGWNFAGGAVQVYRCHWGLREIRGTNDTKESESTNAKRLENHGD